MVVLFEEEKFIHIIFCDKIQSNNNRKYLVYNHFINITYNQKVIINNQP